MFHKPTPAGEFPPQKVLPAQSGEDSSNHGAAHAHHALENAPSPGTAGISGPDVAVEQEGC